MRTIRRSKDTNQYEIQPGIALVSLKGCWDKTLKHRPTLFINAAWFAIGRNDAANIIKTNRNRP